jgi:hypothetical protein
VAHRGLPVGCAFFEALEKPSRQYGDPAGKLET